MCVRYCIWERGRAGKSIRESQNLPSRIYHPFLTYNGEGGMRYNNFYFFNGNSNWSILQENAKIRFSLVVSKNLCLTAYQKKLWEHCLK